MIEKLTEKDIKEVAGIHKTELSGFLSELGLGFLEKFYKATLSIPEIFTFVEKENDQVLGFTTGITSTNGLYKKVIYSDIPSFFLLFLKYFITHPQNIIKTVQLLAYPGFSDQGPELLVIAIDKTHQRRGIGGKLFHKVITEFQKKGIKRFKVSVYDKLSANKFYQKMGCRKVQTFLFLAEPMNYYQFSK